MRESSADFQELADFEKMPEGPKMSVEGERNHCNLSARYRYHGGDHHCGRIYENSFDTYF